jgi:subtilisin family serine protease
MQVFSRIADTTFCNGAAACVGSFSSDQVKALEAIFKKRKTQKVAAVNMSLGGGSFSSACDTNDPMLTSIISKLRKAGIAVAIASGNNGFDGSIGSPACISHAITVGNSTDADNVSPSSNHSKDVDVMAPGTNILAAVLGGNGAIDNKTGTSMAAPHVAGAFALLRAAMGSKLKAKEAVDKIELALECTGAPVSRNDLEKPRINIFSAFKYLKRPPKGEVWNFKKDDDGWESIIGKFVAKNGNYIVKKFASAGWAVSRAPYCDDDVVVKSRMLRKDPAVNIHYNTGLLIGTFNKKGRSATGYWYAFNKLGGGQVVIWRIDGYNFETRSGPASLLCTSSVPIKIGGYNKITAYLKGGKQVLQLNGKTACTATDTTYDKIREVGMAAAVDQASPGGHSVKIDAVAVVPVGQRTPAIEQVSSIVSTQSKAFTHSPLGAVRNNKVMSSTAH